MCPVIKTQHKRNRIHPRPTFLSDLSPSPSRSCHCLPQPSISTLQTPLLTSLPLLWCCLATHCSSLLPARLVILSIHFRHCFAEGPPRAPYCNPHPHLAQQPQHPAHPHRLVFQAIQENVSLLPCCDFFVFFVCCSLSLKCLPLTFLFILKQ